MDQPGKEIGILRMDVSNKIRSVSSFGEDDLLAALTSNLSDKNSSPLTLKSVFKQQNDKWSFLIGHIGISPASPKETIITEYSDYLFVSKAVTKDDVLTIIKNLSGDGFHISETPLLYVKSENGVPRCEWELMPSHATKKEYPARRYSIKLNNNASLFDTPLIGFNKPFHMSSLEYIRDFLDIGHFSSDNNSISGALLLDVYDFRYRIVISEDTLKMEGVDKNACIVGATPTDSHINLLSGEEIPFEPKSLYDSELWLISKDHEVLDYRSQIAWQYRMTKDDSHQDFLDQCKSLINSCEGLYCEFKSFIDTKSLDSSKAFELEKSVCAFSNAKGGMLFIGINNEGTILGLNDKLTKLYKMDFEEALDQYCRDLQKRLVETLKVNNCFAIRPIILFEKQLIAISVNSVNETNYILHSEIAYIRKSGTSKKLAFVEERISYRPLSDLF
jgi:hypothetical protein